MAVGASRIRGRTRVVARMVTADRINVENAKSFAQLGCRNKRLVYGVAVQRPLNIDRQIASDHVALNAGRLTEVRGIVAEGECGYFRRD